MRSLTLPTTTGADVVISEDNKSHGLSKDEQIAKLQKQLAHYRLWLNTIHSRVLQMNPQAVKNSKRLYIGGMPDDATEVSRAGPLGTALAVSTWSRDGRVQRSASDRGHRRPAAQRLADRARYAPRGMLLSVAVAEAPRFAP